MSNNPTFLTPTRDLARELEEMIRTGAVTTPVFVRFQTSEQYLTVAVCDLTCDCDFLTIITSCGNTVSIKWNDLLSVVAFKDSLCRPVFLDPRVTSGPEPVIDELAEATYVHNENTQDALWFLHYRRAS